MDFMDCKSRKHGFAISLPLLAHFILLSWAISRKRIKKHGFAIYLPLLAHFMILLSWATSRKWIGNQENTDLQFLCLFLPTSFCFPGQYPGNGLQIRKTRICNFSASPRPFQSTFMAISKKLSENFGLHVEKGRGYL
ncbi:hypothetical protein SUGI_0976120 [Cryptomeria japonica]|nr:hypothetical protein SUGI_0975960 [Cryptomeria japonica]GLJ46302.1 hypothetical protein SUGI_0976000 [Cryptomeria japonica]GLJ46308.1 hypothetical protein SUGI_0976120 [Cryptomeria japonica]